MNKRRNVEEARAFRLKDSQSESVENLRAVVKKKLRKLERHTTRAVPLREIRDRIFSGRLNVSPDGQRDVVCDEVWMTNLVTSIFDIPFPIEPLLVNAIPRPTPGDEFQDVWNVHRGKQRSSTLFAFFAGLVPIKFKKKSYYWTDPREGPTGADFLFRRDSGRGEGVPHSLRVWNSELDLSRNVAEEFREGTDVFTQSMQDEFLSSTIDVQILPNWPGESSALCTVWGEVNCYKHTTGEFIYGIPCLAPLKSLELSINTLAHKFGIAGAKQPFLDLCRAYLILVGADFVPTYDNTTRADAVAVQLCCEFVLKNGNAEAKIAKNVKILKQAICFLNHNADLLFGDNARRVKTMTSDCLVHIIVVSCYHETLDGQKPGRALDVVNRTIAMSRLGVGPREKYWKTKWLVEAPPTKNIDRCFLIRVWVEAINQMNLVPISRGLLRLHLEL